jgi:hypothetical protein
MLNKFGDIGLGYVVRCLAIDFSRAGIDVNEFGID